MYDVAVQITDFASNIEVVALHLIALILISLLMKAMCYVCSEYKMMLKERASGM